MKEKFEYLDEICLCGSGKLYSECCKKKIDISRDKNVFKGFMNEFDKIHKHYRKVCVHPKQDECSTVRTHAHTISQKAVLELIADNGVVLMPIVFGITNEFRMEPLGIEAKATKFYCFCSKHDQMFDPIDKREVSFTDYTYFLYAYRTFASTYYKIIREIDCHHKLEEKYDLTCNPLALLANRQMEKNKLYLDEYKIRFDGAILTETYDCLETVMVSLDYRVYFAAATCFCPMMDVFGNALDLEEAELPLVYISVIPNEKDTNIIFSWFKEDNIHYAFYKRQIEIAPRRFFLKYLNNLLPLNCENITVSPKLWNRWGESGQEDFVKIAYDHLNDYKIKCTSYEYFEERKYNLFLRI